jgi:hypothetical protein
MSRLRQLRTILGCPLLFLLAACSSPEKAANEAAKRRIWGREDPPKEVEAKAAEPLDPTLLDGDAKVRARIVEMRFDEIVARLQTTLEYRGIARIDVGRGKQRFAIAEDTTIRTGLHGSFQVLQRDGEGAELRQGIYNNGVFYFANGGGKMRVEGIVHDRAFAFREEAWQPLRTFAAYYGPRFGLAHAGTADVDHRGAVKYRVTLAEGPETIPGGPGDTPKKPKTLEGTLWFDAKTAVPLKGDLKGELESEPAGKDGGEPGKVNFSLEFSIRTIEGDEIKPKRFIPTIERHPTDLEPLLFLDGGIRTSTVIGGGRPHKPPKVATSTHAQ